MATIEEIYIIYCISYALYLFIFSFSIVLGIYFFQKARLKKEKLKRWTFFTISAGCFFLSEGIAHFFSWYFMFIYPQDLGWFYSIVTAPTRTDPGLISLVFIQVGLVFYGFFFLAFGIENEIIKKTKYTLTIILFITSTIVLLTPYQIAVTIQIIPISIITVIGISIVIIYFYHAYKYTGKIRYKFLKIGIGFLIFYTGILVNSLSFRVALHLTGNLYTITIFSPFFIICGLLLLFLGYKQTDV